MDLETVKTLSEVGMGMASFIVLLYGVLKTMKFMDSFLGNHMHHVQSSLENIENHMKDMRDALNRLAQK